MKQKKTWSRWLSAMLLLSMLLAMLPASASADAAGSAFDIAPVSARSQTVSGRSTPITFAVHAINVPSGNSVRYLWYRSDAEGTPEGAVLSESDSLTVTGTHGTPLGQRFYYCVVASLMEADEEVEQRVCVFDAAWTGVSRVQVTLTLPEPGASLDTASLTLPNTVMLGSANWESNDGTYRPDQPFTLTLELIAAEGEQFEDPFIFVNGIFMQLLSVNKSTVRCCHTFAAIPFTDVTPGSWYYEPMRLCYELQLVNGTGTGTTFSPTVTLTRAMLAQIFYALVGKPAVSKVTDQFADVAADKWYANAITWCAENGIASGYGNGCFGPNDTVTREQVAVMFRSLAKACGYNEALDADITYFADVEQVSGWAEQAVQWAVGNGLISGKRSGSQLLLAPKDGTSRAEAVTILRAFVIRFVEGFKH